MTFYDFIKFPFRSDLPFLQAAGLNTDTRKFKLTITILEFREIPSISLSFMNRIAPMEHLVILKTPPGAWQPDSRPDYGSGSNRPVFLKGFVLIFSLPLQISKIKQQIDFNIENLVLWAGILCLPA
jgi:hypothetical protein